MKFCIRRSWSIQDCIEALKVCFVEVASEQIQAEQIPANASRISVLTGLYRKEVLRILNEARTAVPQNSSSFLWRILGQWEQDKEFHNKHGKPRPLSYRGDDSEFKALVSKVTKHVSTGSVLSELVRQSLVEKDEEFVSFKFRIQYHASNATAGLDLLARDVTALFEAVEENLFAPKESPSLHISTSYDNVFYAKLPEIREWLLEEGKIFHRKARAYIAQFDADINAESEATGVAGAKVTVGTFSFTDLPKEVSEQIKESPTKKL